MRVLRGVLLTAGILVALAGSAHAQAIGQIFGKVTDTTGGVMPGVTVTVTGTGLQQPLVAVTATSGAYTFPNVPIGTYTVTFELSGFKKGIRAGVVIETGFSAMIDMKMEVGTVTQEVSVTAQSPVVDTKKTSTGGTFTADVMSKIPTARDPWQIINMAPGVTLSGTNVGGSGSGQQLTPSVYGTSANVQWNLEGGNITDMSSNSSPSYFNFDSFQEIQVVTGGGDVSVQSGGLFINLVTKSGSNVFKGTGTITFENASMQSQNVSEKLFNSAGQGGISGNPLHRIGNYSVEAGGPIKRNRLWYWGSMDHQDINVGITNFFDNNNPACVPPPSTYAQLSLLQGCLKNDQTIIRDYNAKVNFQLNAGNKFQFLTQTNLKHRNARGASRTTAVEDTYQQYSKGGEFANPAYQLTHTLILTDKLVFTNQATYLSGGFFLDFQDYTRCGSSTQARALAGQLPTDPTCMINIQPLSNRTTSYTSRGLTGGTYETVRPSWEIKTDGNYFLSHKLGGDHALKFGVGWRRNPVSSYSTWGGGAVADIQCVGNVAANCGDGVTSVPVGSAAGIVPYRARLFRDALVNNDWWTYSSYIQDSYSRGRLRLNGGVRQDWQTSRFRGGCVLANPIRPDLLPKQCQDPANPGFNFNNLSPRVSATYDMFGTGKTSIHSSFSYYYQSRLQLGNALSNLGGVTLTWGANQSSGACSTTAGAPCWTDANMDQKVQANELIGIPSASTSRFDATTGVLSNAAPIVDKGIKLQRIRETITGVDHELVPNMHVAVDFIYRYTDLGTTTYSVGYEPGAAGFPFSQIYTDRVVFTDPITGKSAPYYVPCATCVRATGLTNMTGTSLSYTIYRGVQIAVGKRMSNKWQLNGSYAWNNVRAYSPLGTFNDPTGIEFTNGFTNGTARWVVKINGSIDLPWGILAAANFNSQDGSVRTRSINGPGTIFAGLNAAGAATTTTRNTLNFEPTGSERFKPFNQVDLSASKIVTVPGSTQKLTLTLDAFNVGNASTIRSYASSNLSLPVTYAQVGSIVPPRVFRVGARFAF
jgi:carboxypeptidase family protein